MERFKDCIEIYIQHDNIFPILCYPEVRLKPKVTGGNYIPTHLNIFDACTESIAFIDFKDKNNFLNDPRFIHGN